MKYLKLFENGDDAGGSYNRDAIPFLYYNNKLYYGENSSKHGEIRIPDIHGYDEEDWIYPELARL